VLDQALYEFLLKGTVIPAHPLALDARRKLDERRQRALSRYYLAAGGGGLAVGVHTTQFAIHDSKVGLYEPVLAIAGEEMDRVTDRPIIRVAGLVGKTEQAVREATLARDLGYHAGLLSLAAMKGAHEDALLAHCRAVADVIPLFGFYLQPAVGGVELPHSFWRRFVTIENVVAIKVAAFDRYRTLDVVRAIAESGRDDIALYTGNDDHIVLDLITPFRFTVNGQPVERRFVGGLLGHWAVWTHAAARLLEDCHSAVERGSVRIELLVRANEVTDANAALFDAANNYSGCIAGIHEVLRRQGLLEGTWCLDPHERLSPGQAAEIDRVLLAYPHLTDDAFVAEHLDEWH
jgi:dihydrodipicolinate synthase/N-acetylneuraminate lyase